LSSSPHSLNFIQPILVLAVTATSHPPVAFNQQFNWFLHYLLLIFTVLANKTAKQAVTFLIFVHLAWIHLQHIDRIHHKSLDHLEEWSLKWHLPVNSIKYECCFFSTDPHQALHQPQLTLTGIPLTFNAPSSSVWPLTELSPLVRMSSPPLHFFCLKVFPQFKAFRSIWYPLHGGVPPKSHSPNCTKLSSPN